MVTKTRTKPRRGPIRDRKYLAWIRERPCILGGSCRRIEAAHIGPHGLGQKASDHATLPLCSEHHRDLHELGVPFWERYAIDRDRLIAHYREMYLAEVGALSNV